jgi:CheY-like chemotaxis protein
MDDPDVAVEGVFHVLVADDSQEMRDLLFDALQSIDCMVTCVGDGLEALARLEIEPYDLLITDYCMPRLNGLALLRQVQARTIPLPAILITGQASSDVIEQAEQAGAIWVIPKPIVVPRVLSLVGLIRSQRLAR